MENPEVIRAAQAGDAQAFAALYSAFKTKVYQRCLFMVRNKEDAEDLTQEVFLRLHNKIGQYDFRSKFATWLYTVTMTTAINWINRKKEDPESIEERDFEDTCRNNPCSAAQEALENLPKRLKQIARLRLVEGYSLSETSEMLGIQPMAVVRRTREARDRLQEKLRP